MKVYSIAFHYFLTSAKYNSKNAEAYMFIGISLNKLQDPANAFNAFEKAVQIDPENHLIFLNYAIFLAEHSKDPANVRLAKDKFEIHDQLYKGMNQRDPQVDAQRNIIKSILGSESI